MNILLYNFLLLTLDLKSNETLNEMATNATRISNFSGPFRIEHFDYDNTVVVDHMMHNWEQLTFTGITVSFKCHKMSLACKPALSTQL